MKTHRSTQLFLYCSGSERSVKFVHPALEMEASNKEQRGVVHFLVAEGAGTREIHHLMSAVYGEHCMTLTSVHEWQTFREERTSLQDYSRPGQSHRAIAPNVIVRIHGLTYIFGDLKKDIRGRRFYSYEEVQECVRLWIHQRPTSFIILKLIVSSPSGINVLTLLAITFE